MKIILAVLVAILFTTSLILNKNYSRTHARNFLTYKSIDLSLHLISNHQTTRKKAVLLGSSSVAGNNIHKNSSLADFLNVGQEDYFFYNLGSLEGTLLDSMVFLDQAESKTKIDLAVIGLSPDMFTFNSSSLVPIANIEILKKFLPPDQIEKIEEEKQRKFYFKPVIDFVAEETIPYKFILDLKARMNNVAKHLYGPFYDAHVSNDKMLSMNFIKDERWLKNLKSLVEYCRSHHIAVVFYLEPNLKVDQYFANAELEVYINRLNDFFEANKLPAYNLMQSLANTPEFFVDYQHLTPMGYKNLALNIRRKLEEGAHL